MRLSKEVMAAFRATAHRQADKDIALRFREKNGAEIAHLNDEELLAAIRQARETAVGFGITDHRLRMRFIMLDVFRLPGFWRDGTVQRMLNAGTGTPDMRFGDVCALLKIGAFREGRKNYVWWS